MVLRDISMSISPPPTSAISVKTPPIAWKLHHNTVKISVFIGKM